jgi:ribokinase
VRNSGPVRVAVVGHVEWVEFVHADHVPAAGEIVHASEAFEEPAGGGAVAAVQLARMAGACDFFTALGADDLAERTRARLPELDVSVHAAERPGPTRRAFTFLDARGERTITTIGERLEPRGDDPLPWQILERVEGVYVTAGDEGALRAARRAGVVVASPRAGHVLAESEVKLDALVFSDRDELESSFARALEPRPALMIATRGADGGRYETADGKSGTWSPASPPGPIADAYGSGDSFAAAFTYGLAAGEGVEASLRLGAEAGAAGLTRRGPYG